MSPHIRFTTWQMIRLIVMTLSGILTAIAFGVELVFGFIPGLGYLIHLTRKNGASLKGLAHASTRGALQAKEVMVILLLVGMLLPSWYMSGTIPKLVEVALDTLSINHFLVTSFLASLALSMVLGTSVGSLSALGIPIITTAESVGIPLGMAAGALVSGAIVGDRTSPLSSAHQLLSYTIEVPVARQFRAMLPTTGVAVLVSGVLFMILDTVKGLSPSTEVPFQSIAVSSSMFVLMPPVLLIAIVLFRVKIRWAFIASITFAAIIALYNGVPLSEWMGKVFSGIDGLGGGIASMMWLVAFIAAAGAFNGILEEYQIVQPIIGKWFSQQATHTRKTGKTIGAAAGVAVIGCNQTLPIIMTGRSLLPYWQKNGGDLYFARIMGDSAMVIPGLIPWNMLAIMCSTILGVPVLQYVAFAFFPILLPFITLGMSFFQQRYERKHPKNVSMTG